MIVQAGATGVITYFVLRTAADGTATTGATITNIDLQYVRSGAAPSAKVDATALGSTDAAHDGGNKAIEIDATDAPGKYRVDWPDAAFAAGVREVILTVKLASSFTEHLRVELSPAVDVQAVDGAEAAAANLNLACDNYSATRGLAGTALPAAAADAAGGVPVSDAGGLDIDAIKTKTDGLNFDGNNVLADVMAMNADVITAAALAASAGAEIAALVETYIVNEGDATAVMQAIADVIAADWIAGDASPLAIASAVWASAARALTEKTGFSLAADQSAVTIGTVTTNTDMRGTDSAYTGTPPTAVEIADAVLVRAVEQVEDSADKHSLGALVMFVTNWSASGTTVTAKKPSDDSTFNTYTLVEDADGNPIVGVS